MTDRAVPTDPLSLPLAFTRPGAPRPRPNPVASTGCWSEPGHPSSRRHPVSNRPSPQSNRTKARSCRGGRPRPIRSLPYNARQMMAYPNRSTF